VESEETSLGLSKVTTVDEEYINLDELSDEETVDIDVDAMLTALSDDDETSL